MYHQQLAAMSARMYRTYEMYIKEDIDRKAAQL